MNDPVLNRTLFRHQAQIVHNQIPKFVEGGDAWYKMGAEFKAKQAAAQKYFKGHDKLKLLASALGPGKFFKGAKTAYQATKAARAASIASGKRGRAT